MSSTTGSSIMKIFQRVIGLCLAQDFKTIGNNSRTQSVRDTPPQCPLPNGEVSRKYLKGVLELWAAQDLKPIEGNSKTESARVVFLYATGLLNVLYVLKKYHENILKGFRVMDRTIFYNFGILWEITSELSRLELSFLHATLLPNTT